MNYTCIELLPMLMVIFALIFGGGGIRRGGCSQPTCAKWDNNNERPLPAPRKDENL